MSTFVALDLLIPGMVCYAYTQISNGEFSSEPTHWTQDESEIQSLIRDAAQIGIAIDDQYWITKTIPVPARFRTHKNEVGIFELGGSLSDQPDDFLYAISPSSAHTDLGYSLVSAIRKERAYQLFSSLLSSGQLEHVRLVPRSMMLASGWMQLMHQPRASLLVTQHQGVGALAMVRGDELLLSTSLRIRATRASQFAAVAGLEIATQLSNIAAHRTTPQEILEAQEELSRVVCFGDLDTEQVRSELVARLNLVVESGSSSVYPSLPIPMRLRDSWLVAIGMMREYSSRDQHTETEIMTIREGRG
jgi:hypothetical protein